MTCLLLICLVAQQPDVIFTATPLDVVDAMLETAKVSKNDVVYDLGCGDGRILTRAAQKYGCKCYGVDLDEACVALSKAAVSREKLQHLIQIEKKDMFSVDLSSASIVTLYVLPSMLERLKPQLMQLRPGSRVISHEFPIKGFAADKTITVQSRDGKHIVFMWITPFKSEVEK